MPTIIKTITYMCLTGIGNLNASCRFHRRIDNLTKDNCCPNHKWMCSKTDCKFNCGDDNAPINKQGQKVCYFHEELLIPNLNPSPQLVLATNPDDQCTTTIMDEAKFDDSNLIEHGLNTTRWMTHAEADEQDTADLQGYLKKINRELAIDALAEGKSFKPLTEKDNHGWVAPVRRELDQAEREKWKAKIRADIIKFKALEHK